MPPSGTDETLKLEAVYLSAPIPRNLAVLTAMGAIFDKVYFPAPPALASHGRVSLPASPAKARRSSRATARRLIERA